jgi:hypothetical protein
MGEDIRHDAANIGVRLLDDAYMAWFIAESECEQTLRLCFEAPPARHAELYSVYRAALAREEAAAHDLRRLLELTEPCQCVVAGPEQAGLR